MLIPHANSLPRYLVGFRYAIRCGWVAALPRDAQGPLRVYLVSFLYVIRCGRVAASPRVLRR